MNKRGSHVEVVISFIIFITFIIFIFTILKPSITTKTDKENVLDSIELSLINRTSSNMTMITVNLPSGGEPCIKLSNLLTNLNIGKNIVVKNYTGKTVSSNINGNSLQINRNINEEFFKIYYSKEFKEILVSSTECNIVPPTLGLIKTDKYVFESKVLFLIGQYSNYEILKRELKIPEEVDFGYGIRLSNGTTFETTGEEELSTNIYIKETPIEYVDSEGNILVGFFKTKAW